MTASSDEPAVQADHAALERAVYHEMRLLDERRFEEWMDLFTEDGYYWAPTQPDQRSPHDHVSLIHDDREFMKARIGRLRHPRMHQQTPPSRACRLVSNVRVEPDPPSGAQYLVASVMVMFEYRKGEQRVFAGHCQHAFRYEGSEFKIAWKRVDLINSDDVFPMIAVPF